MKLLLKSLLLFVLISCQPDAPEKILTLNEKLNFNEIGYRNEISKVFTDNNFTFGSDTIFQFKDTLNYFYSTRSLHPVFINSFEDEGVVSSILEFIKHSDEHGLNPEFYDYTLIKNEFYNAINDTIENHERHKQLAAAEVLLSNALIRYSYHLRFGYVNPKLIFADSYFIPLPDSASRNLFEPLEQENIIDYLNSIQPSGEKYVKLQNELKHYRNFVGQDWPEITIASAKLQKGDSDTALFTIATRLITLGFLDTTAYKIYPDLVYDSVLVGSIKKFQSAHGLNDDGVIGIGTLQRLNITPEEYVTTIKINLERFRWIDYSNTPQYLMVNIPDFKVYAYDNNQEVFNIKVCTGIKRASNYKERFAIYKRTKKLHDKPDDWETPCLYSEVSYMVLNPTWTVPASIIREEILREVRKDSNYLYVKNFKVFKDGVELDLNEVDVNEFSSSKIPYTIVQDPGVGNALGRIKFMFNNPFGVYLHDTPTRAPFNSSNRAVSHGCVRVEKPIMLAEFLLKDHQKWNVDFLKLEIGQKVEDRSVQNEFFRKRSELRRNASFGKTTEIILDKKIPLYIDYYTAWVDDEGVVNFREDIYRKDKELIDYMFPDTFPAQVALLKSN